MVAQRFQTACARPVNVTATGEDWSDPRLWKQASLHVTDDLTREGRGWRLSDPIVDDEFLRHHLGEHR